MNNEELETYVTLRYFPLHDLEESTLNKFPPQVLDKLKLQLRDEYIDVLATYRRLGFMGTGTIEKALFDLCIEYHSKSGIL